MRNKFLNDLQNLHPELEKREYLLLQRMTELGHPMRMTAGLRTLKEQLYLFNQGRTVGGKIVTNEKVSLHNLGLACDNCFLGSDPFPNPETSPLWETYMAEARKFGLTCGGDWENFKDYPHIQLTPELHAMEVVNLYLGSSLDKIWFLIDSKLGLSSIPKWIIRIGIVKELLNE